MSLAPVIEHIPGITPIDGLRDAWWWSPSPRFRFSICLAEHGQHAFRLNTIDQHDEPLIREVLSYARAHERILTDSERASRVAGGFSFPGFRFDVVAGVPEEVHRFHEFENKELAGKATAVFPAYRCEFADDETMPEAQWRFDRMLHSSNLSRGPSPFLRLQYDNPKTGGGSDGVLFAEFDTLAFEIGLLAGAPQAFIEFENFERKFWRITWDGRWLVAEDDDLQFGDVEEVKAWASAMCFGPNAR